MEKLKRYIIFIVGLYLNSLGVSVVTKASLGTSPISSIPYVLSINFPFTLGQFTIVFSLLLIALQLFILGRNFRLEHILQIPVSILFGYFIDFSMYLLFFVQSDSYLIQILYLLIGCLILGFGVYMEVLANVVMLPGESFVRAIVFRWKTDFGITKICFDVSMSVIAATLSLILAHRLDGVREGTIIAALLVGFIARQFGKLLAFLPDKIYHTTEQSAASSAPHEPPAEPVCIVIARQYGSGGHALGKRLANELGYAFYDNQLIQMTAASTSYTPEYIENRETHMTNSLLYDLVNQVYNYSGQKSTRDTIFEAESEVVRKLAAKENCVIVGRFANYALRNQPRCLRIFCHAPLSYRIPRIAREESVSEETAAHHITQTDQSRSDIYQYYTHRVWGNSSDYTLSIDMSLGEDYAEEIIHKALARI